MLLNMVAEEADANRRASAALVREPPDWLLGEIERLTEGPTLFAPARHPVLSLDVNEKRLKSILVNAHERHPQDFETLLGLARASGRRPSAACRCWPRSFFRPRPPTAILPNAGAWRRRAARRSPARGPILAAGPTTRTPMAERTARRFRWTGQPMIAISPS